MVQPVYACSAPVSPAGCARWDQPPAGNAPRSLATIDAGANASSAENKADFRGQVASQGRPVRGAVFEDTVPQLEGSDERLVG
jgi:hypothetical protein